MDDEDIEIVGTSSARPTVPTMRDIPPPTQAPAASASQSTTTAKRRWNLLSKHITKNSKRPRDEVGPSDFSAPLKTAEFLELYKYQEIERNENGIWSKIIWNDGENDWPQLEIHIYDLKTFDAIELSGFNNTGNVRIWFSEECLAFYLLQNKEDLKEKSILELGSGMTGLAGLCASVYAKEVYLNDGNEKSVQNISSIIKRNDMKNCESLCFKWDESELSKIYGKKFDLIIGADCFFHEEGHEAFVKALDIFLKDDGIAILCAPERSGTLRLFMEKLFEKKKFIVEQTANVCEKIVEKISILTEQDPNFDADKYHIKRLNIRKDH